jgi:heme/copper-type cytochrome/quinol oxidase subunit 2
MTWFELYIWTRLDAIGFVSVSFAIVSGVTAIITYIYRSEYADSEYYKKEYDHCTAVVRRSMWVFILSLLIAVFVPSADSMTKIYALNWATNNQDVRAIPDDAARLIREWLDEARPEQDTTKGTTK